MASCQYTLKVVPSGLSLVGIFAKVTALAFLALYHL